MPGSICLRTVEIKALRKQRRCGLIIALDPGQMARALERIRS